MNSLKVVDIFNYRYPMNLFQLHLTYTYSVTLYKNFEFDFLGSNFKGFLGLILVVLVLTLLSPNGKFIA